MPQTVMPKVKAPWDQTGANSLKGKGKIPGGKERTVNTGKRHGPDHQEFGQRRDGNG